MKKIRHLLAIIFLVTYAGQTYGGNLYLGNWRWRNDNGGETSATWKKPQNTVDTIIKCNNIRLRVESYFAIEDPAGGDNFEIYLAYRKTEDGASSFTQITDDTSTNHFVLSPSSYFTDMQSTTIQLQKHNSGYENGVMIENSVGPDVYYPENISKEIEFCIRPTSNIESNTEYEFILNQSIQASDVPFVRLVTGNEITPPDLAIEWLSPGILSDTSSRDFISIKIINNSNSDVSNFDVSYSIDNGLTFVTKHVNGPIQRKSSFIYTFPGTEDMSTYKTYNCIASIDRAGDPDNSNSIVSVDVVKENPDLSVVKLRIERQ